MVGEIKALRKNPNFRVNLMGHVIAAEPSIEASERMVEIMVAAGASVIEVQIPFSEPTADGPVFLAANHRALSRGVTYEMSMGLIEKLIQKFGAKADFLVMTYLNIPYQRGYLSWAKELAQVGVKGTIIPDLPYEYAGPYEDALLNEGVFNVRLVAPHGDWQRTATVLKDAQGLVYVVARRGVTGAVSSFDESLFERLRRVRQMTQCPLALGFGIQSEEGVRAISSYVDWAVVGTASLVHWQKDGEEGLKKLWQGLRLGAA